MIQNACLVIGAVGFVVDERYHVASLVGAHRTYDIVLSPEHTPFISDCQAPKYSRLLELFF